MANLVTIAEQVASELGRPELVVNYASGDYTPTAKFRRIINAANKRLERMVDYEAEFRRIEVEIESGDYFVTLPKEIQYIDSIDIQDSTTRYPMNPRSDLWMRENYDEPFSLVETGRPVDWSRWTPDGTRLVDLIVNGDFSTDTDNWTQDTGTLAWSSGKARLTSAGSGSGMYQTFSPTIDIRGYRLNFNVTTSGSVTSYWVSLWNSATNIVLLPMSTSGLIDIDEQMEYLLEQGIYTQSQVDAVTQTCDRIAVVMLGSNGSYIEVDNISLYTARSSSGNLLVLPPSDDDYTLYVRSRVYADDMVNNNDTTWFSNRHPDLLVTMVKRQIAVELNRNETERNEYDNELAVQLFEIEKATAAEEQAGGILSTRMGYMQ
jgi:hypothetical protein